MKRTILIIQLSFIAFWATAQPDLTGLALVDSIRTDYIHTVEFRNTGSEISLPILKLKSGSLICEFDDSYGEYIDYYYTIKHCDKDWNFTKNIEVSDYMDGPEELEIENFASSISTQLNYTHYSFSFPNRDISLRWSGNYMLFVYDSDGTVVITRRFYVYDQQAPIFPDDVRPNGSGTFNTHQAFKVTLGIDQLNPANPIQELYLTAFQNRLNERNTAFIQPSFVAGKEAQFNLMEQISFQGYKEYRFFDTRNVLQAGENVKHIDISNTHIFVLLELDKKRNLKPYYFRKEINGGYVLRNFDRRNTDKSVTSEYPHVLFNLTSSSPEDGDVYVLGEFNDFKAHPDFRMEYIEREGIYSLEVPMKQGFYNYYYALQKRDGNLDIEELEGSSFETENEYHFMCYYRPRGSEYDQLVGYALFHLNNR